MSFAKDKQRGDSAESFVSSLLGEAGISVTANIVRAELSDYDLKACLDTLIFTIECKYDLYESRSGNIAIEFYNPRSCKPTGIDATKADLWVHILTKPTTAWVTRTETLRRYTRENKPSRVVSCGGDDNASIMLYKREIIIPAIFQRLDGLMPISLKELLTELLK